MLRFKEGDIIEVRWNDATVPVGNQYSFIKYNEVREDIYDGLAIRLSDGNKTNIHTPAFWFSIGRRQILTEQTECNAEI